MSSAFNIPADSHAHWIRSADGLSSRNPAPDASPAGVPNSVTVALTYGTPSVDAVPGEPVAHDDYARIGLLEWAVSRWREDVENRPMVNIYRAGMDKVWRQVIRHFGGDPDSIIGPNHSQIESTLAASVASRAGSEPVATKWYELNPPTLELGRTYLTRDGRSVKMVEIANAGKEYESMADEVGHHRYSRSHGRIIGRCTGSANDDPGNIVFEAPPIAPAAAAEPSDAWTRVMNAALTYRNIDPEAMDEQDAWVALVDAIGTIAPDRERAASLVASEDTRRLDYLQQTGSTVELVPGGHGGLFFRIGGLYRAVHADIRQAIDAARVSAGEAQS